jgi:hypothetical protein
MARKMDFRKKTSRVNRATQPMVASDVAAYGHDLGRWPRSWMGVEEDLPVGEALLDHFRPFLQHLASSGLSPKTIRRHVDNLWMLGGEIIRELNDDPSLRKLTTNSLLSQGIDQDGGPLLYSGSEEEQRSFDSTCRKLYRFLCQQPG